jgi:predicted enzyme related to lactoylglutathione lyase
MSDVVGPGFISITVSDVQRAAAFYEQHLGARRDPFDFGSSAVVFLGWPTISVSAPRPGQPGPNPDGTSIALWWRSADAQALYERVVDAGVTIVREPIDGPFGRQFTMADPDGYRITIYERDQPLYWPPKA